MVASILLFEVRQRLRRISTYIYFVVFFALGFLFVNLAGGALPGGSVDFGTGGKVLLNSPFALMLIITYVSFYGVIITAALAGQATYQDIDHNCAAFFYTAPISKFDYLGGRFLGSIVVQLLIFSSVGLGTWVGTHMPWLDRTRFGPENFLGYLQPYFVLVLPNLFFTTAIFFAIAVLARKMLPVYVGSVLLLVGYFAAAQLSNNPIVTPLAALADPFGANAFGRITQYWTPFERNTRLIPLAGILLANRALWIGVGIVILGVAYSRFSFARALSVGKRRQQADTQEIETFVPAARLLPVVHPVFSLGASFGQLVSFTRLQFTETVKNVFFVVLVFSGYLLAVLTASDVTDPISDRKSVV